MMAKIRRDSITVAGRSWDVPARFRYDDFGEADTYRFRAHADEYSIVTNCKGDGLFLFDKACNVHQITGTVQFHASSLEQFRRKLAEWLMQ